MTDALPLSRVPAPGKRISIVLAISVHLVLLAILIYGVRWQTKVNDVVEVDLVRATPSPPAAVPAVPVREVIKPEPKPEPKPRVEARPLPPPPKPDIAIKTKEKPKPPAKEEPKAKFDPFKQQLAEEEAQRTLQKQLADDERKAKAQRDAQVASARSKAEATYAERIRARIRSNIVLPPDLHGNPAALFEVVQLPSGEVISARLLKGSGHAGYDAAVERAILKSSPLPRPDDLSLFARSLRLTFCPLEDGKCG
jgi:colicin import membrane protein